MTDPADQTTREESVKLDPWEELRADIDEAIVRNEWGQSADSGDELIARYRLAIEDQAATEARRELDVDVLKRAMAKQLSGLITTGMAQDVAAEYRSLIEEGVTP